MGRHEPVGARRNTPGAAVATQLELGLVLGLVLGLLAVGCGSDTEDPAPADTSTAVDALGDDANRSDVQTDWDSSGPDISDEPIDYQSYDLHPEPPAFLRDVARIDDDLQWTAPFVPGHRTTMDGRVAIRVQGGPPGDRLRTKLSFFLFAPEKLDEPIMTGPSGPRIMADTTPWDVDFPPALADGVKTLGHHTICDPTQEFAVPGEKPNPYACGPENAHDCYDITVISSTSDNSAAQLWGTPVTVEVASPKTASAHIVDVTLGTSVAGALIPNAIELTEPTVTQDGRLITGRLDRSPRDWENPQTGEQFNRFYDLMYAVLPAEVAPCDVTGWVNFHPTSYAPYDPDVVGTYGMGAYPFRDSEGVEIPVGEDLGGTYPWVDREGTNVFMTGVLSYLTEQSQTDYPHRCAVPGCEQYKQTPDWTRGYLVAGLWTHGKFVHLDGLINHTDWGVGVTPTSHYLVDLYRKASGEAVSVRVGGGRFMKEARGQDDFYPPGYTHNANVLDSLQNLLTHHQPGRPVTPRDVVWVMSTGVATDEIAFDDLLDPNALIVANMQATITQSYSETLGMLISMPEHHNGQVRLNTAGLPLAAGTVLDTDQKVDIHLQNGATSLAWNVPAFGVVAAGEARVEPVANGGIRGRGFWLSGKNAITYEIGAQPQNIREHDWYVGLFIDPRAAAGERRNLLSFPDGSRLMIDGHARVRYVVNGSPVHEVALPFPAAAGWMHLGLRLTNGSQTVTLVHNGFTLDRFESNTPLFELSEGSFVVGERGDDAIGARGWIDNLVVLAHDLDVEVACNQALGTLVQVDNNAQWDALAAHYPDHAHSAVAVAAGASGTRFACFHDYSGDFAANLTNLPSGTVGLRDAVIFPEGPIRSGAPRPDSSQNAFCLTCHHADGHGALSLDALTLNPALDAEDDPRRQPMQPPRRIFGNIPAGWLPPGIGPGSPNEATVAPADGALVDRWLLEAAP